MRDALVLSALWFVLAGSSSAPTVADANTRQHVIAGYAAVMKSWDKDGDGKLSRAEVAFMVNQFFDRLKAEVSDGKAHPEIDLQRHEFVAFYESQDANRDGYLTLDELSKVPLASFDCMDENHDGKVTKDEQFTSMDRCRSVDLDDYAPKR